MIEFMTEFTIEMVANHFFGAGYELVKLQSKHSAFVTGTTRIGNIVP